jgi:hypothetical protein
VTDPRCALCLALFGARAAEAATTVNGTAVCADHVSYLLDPRLVASARADADPGIYPPTRRMPAAGRPS